MNDRLASVVIRWTLYHSIFPITVRRHTREHVRNSNENAYIHSTRATAEHKGQPMLFKRSRILWGVAAFVLILGIAAIAAGPIMSMVEQPEYKVVTSKRSIEIREYGPMIAAEAEVAGERQTAIGQGFRLIAAYIFGANKPNAKIEMTAPVQQQREQTIAMTAPVTQQNDGGKWKVRFIMPKSWTMETLPAPNDTRVKLIQLPAKKMVAIRFTWRASDSLIAEKTAELRKYVRDEKLATVGEPLFAFYNPPWTLPFLRRNEIMLELAGT